MTSPTVTDADRYEEYRREVEGEPLVKALADRLQAVPEASGAEIADVYGDVALFLEELGQGEHGHARPPQAVEQYDRRSRYWQRIAPRRSTKALAVGLGPAP